MLQVTMIDSIHGASWLTLPLCYLFHPPMPLACFLGSFDKNLSQQ
jgi:hypothetical protein